MVIKVYFSSVSGNKEVGKSCTGVWHIGTVYILPGLGMLDCVLIAQALNNAEDFYK